MMLRLFWHQRLFGVTAALFSGLLAASCADLATVAPVTGEDASHSIEHHESFSAAYIAYVEVWGSWYGDGDPGVCWTLYGPGSPGSSGMRCGNATFSDPLLANDLWVEPYGDPYDDDAFVTAYELDPIDEVTASCNQSGSTVSCSAVDNAEDFALSNLTWRFVLQSDGSTSQSYSESSPVYTSSWSFNPGGAVGRVALSYNFGDGDMTERDISITGQAGPSFIVTCNGQTTSVTVVRVSNISCTASATSGTITDLHWDFAGQYPVSQNTLGYANLNRPGFIGDSVT